MHVFVADVVKSFDPVDREILDRVLRSFGLLAWFRHAYFEYHARVRLRFKLVAVLSEPWTRDDGVPQGCPLSMMFKAQYGVSPQLYADNLKCVSWFSSACCEVYFWVYPARWSGAGSC